MLFKLKVEKLQDVVNVLVDAVEYVAHRRKLDSKWFTFLLTLNETDLTTSLLLHTTTSRITRRPISIITHI